MRHFEVSYDIMDPELPQSDYDLFFGSIENGQTLILKNYEYLSEILTDLGLAQSKQWCRKNNWHIKLSPGYSEYIFGSKRTLICVLKRTVLI